MPNMWWQLPKLQLDLQPCYDIIEKASASDEPNKYNLNSIKLPESYLTYLKNKIYAKVDYASVAKFYPDSWFNWHKDGRRTCAINILLSDNHHDQYSKMIDPNSFKVFDVPYYDQTPLLYNTKNIHMVQNNHQTDARYVLTISFYDNAHDGSQFTFNEIVNLYENDLLINNTDQIQK